MNSNKYAAYAPDSMLTRLKDKWPGAIFNLDIGKCQEIIERIVRPQFIENAFVAGGFFINFNINAPFSQKFKLYYDQAVCKYGLSIFFDKIHTDDFNRDTIINADLVDKFKKTTHLEKFGFEVWTAHVNDVLIRINLSQFENGFGFLEKFDYESSKIWYTLKNPNKVYVSTEFLNGTNISKKMAQIGSLVVAASPISFSTKERRLVQVFKGLSEAEDENFLNESDKYF